MRPTIPGVLLASLLTVTTVAVRARAQEQPPSSAPFANRLSGDWGGLRTQLADKGISIELDSTHYYQGLVCGTGPHKGAYAGRFDLYATLDTTKFGLWEGGRFGTHVEYKFGGANPEIGGTILAVDLGARLPQNADDRLEATSAYYAQQVGPDLSFMIGKINTVDLLAGHPFFGGAGVTRFWNLAFSAPPNGLTPPVIFGGLASLKAEPFFFSAMVYDPNDRTMEYCPDDIFEDGVNIALAGGWAGMVFERSTRVTVTGIYSSADSIDLSEILLPASLSTGTKSDSYHFSLQIDHFLHENPDRRGTGWGVFVKAGFSDGNPNPFQGFVTGGIGGTGLF